MKVLLSAGPMGGQFVEMDVKQGSVFTVESDKELLMKNVEAAEPCDDDEIPFDGEETKTPSAFVYAVSSRRRGYLVATYQGYKE